MISRDNDGIEKFYHTDVRCIQISLFPDDSSLKNIATSVIADKGINVDMLFAFRKTVVEKMVGNAVVKYNL